MVTYNGFNYRQIFFNHFLALLTDINCPFHGAHFRCSKQFSHRINRMGFVPHLIDQLIHLTNRLCISHFRCINNFCDLCIILGRFTIFDGNFKLMMLIKAIAYQHDHTMVNALDHPCLIILGKLFFQFIANSFFIC
ncbi:hypothetical protein D3C79_861280 [compost metagenome]